MIELRKAGDRGMAVNGQPFGEGDGARIHGEQRLRFSDGEQAEVLVFDLRPRELPAM